MAGKIPYILICLAYIKVNTSESSFTRTCIDNTELKMQV
jgi:hypothetical protein